VRADVARRLLPAIEDDGWFFDTELLLLAERNGLRIHEVPVDWIDDTDSRVRIVRTALEDLAGAARMARTFLAGGGRLDLGDTARVPLADDFGRTRVSAGFVDAAIASIALALFVLLQATVGAAYAGAIAGVWAVAAGGRVLLARRRTSVVSVDRSNRD
jgi:hypothetical protein